MSLAMATLVHRRNGPGRAELPLACSCTLISFFLGANPKVPDRTPRTTPLKPIGLIYNPKRLVFLRRNRKATRPPPVRLAKALYKLPTNLATLALWKMSDTRFPLTPCTLTNRPIS